MKNQKSKIKKIIFYFIFTICYLLFAASTMARIQLETALPPIANQPSPSQGLPQYINYLFIFGLGAITFLALAQMMVGGLTYILAAGNAAKFEDAKNTIQQALLGLGLLLVSYLLLYTINPDLVNFRNPNLTPMQFNTPPGITAGGGGAQNYQWANVPFNQYCASVLGPNWECVDNNLCSSPQPDNTTYCCGYFPPVQ